MKLNLLVVIGGVLCFAPFANADTSNKDEVRKSIEEKGGEVKYIKEFNEAEYAKAGLAIATGQGGLYLADVAKDLAKRVGTELAMDALHKIVKGETITLNGIEIQGGVATYNHTKVTYHHFWDGWPPRWQEIRNETPWFNSHEIYIRIIDKRVKAPAVKAVESRVALDACGGRALYMNSNTLEPNDNMSFKLVAVGGDYVHICPKVANVALDQNGSRGSPYWSKNIDTENDNLKWKVLKQQNGQYMIVPKTNEALALDACGAVQGAALYFNKADPANLNVRFDLIDVGDGHMRIVSAVTVKK